MAINGTNTRSIIHFTKNYISSGFDDLDLDIKLKGKTDPKTTIYVVVYGVKGTVNDVDVKIWDRFYYYDGSNLDFDIPIDMNNNKIIGLADGTADKHAVNKKQLDDLIKLYYRNYNLKSTKTEIRFSRDGAEYINISYGLYIINYYIPVITSSDYDSEGGIEVIITSKKGGGDNPTYPKNYRKNNKPVVFDTNIYTISFDSELRIKTYGSGITIAANAILKYIIILKLPDNLY